MKRGRRQSKSILERRADQREREAAAKQAAAEVEENEDIQIDFDGDSDEPEPAEESPTKVSKTVESLLLHMVLKSEGCSAEASHKSAEGGSSEACTVSSPRQECFDWTAFN